jgi:hypothetical protein
MPKRGWLSTRDLLRIAMLVTGLILTLWIGRNCGRQAAQFLQQLEPAGDAGR